MLHQRQNVAFCLLTRLLSTSETAAWLSLMEMDELKDLARITSQQELSIYIHPRIR
jgi:putative SOS response-associated peptidase YedK